MYISQVCVKNFRLLQDSTMTIDEKQKNLSILLGRNNSGKTSFISIFEKFLLTKPFDLYDYPLALRQKILAFDTDTDVSDLLIQLIFTIQYSKDDSFEHISNFFMDLSPDSFEINILCECSIDSEKFLKELFKMNDLEVRKKYIENNLQEYLKLDFYSFLDKDDLKLENRHKLIRRERKHVDQLINIQVIHARRDVASSEISSASGILSKLANIYFSKEYGNEESNYAEINKQIFEMDKDLDSLYSKHFGGFLANAKDFLELSNLQVKSNLESKRLFSGASKISYGDQFNSLPESLNGLGHLNILYLLMQVELIKAEFTENSRDINLLFIEEPEAHTHPQMQYVFAKKVKGILDEIPKSQAFITTHSSHIVTQCDFKDIKYFKCDKKNESVIIQNFYSELKEKYSKEYEHFKFLKQYLTLYSAELFFAEKVIFIEGTSEAMLLPYFIQKIDKANSELQLSSQNVSIIEIGANAKVFRHFLEFLDIKTLIITDIDTIGEDRKACVVSDTVVDTSNQTIKYYLDAPTPINSKIITAEEKEKIKVWIQKNVINKTLQTHEKIRIAYQVNTSLSSGSYHARSFEDAFISENFELIKTYKDDIQGLKLRKKIDEFDTEDGCFYTLTDDVLYSNGKSDFASSILYLALVENVEWKVPLYIEEGLKWIAN
ncbi:MAG TPA: AAA family ATPase [Aliarcobacter thereius]|nr:AAA family ATPase [Aliarcobacter thereius]HJE03872.1 AAA family ATPase [Aliarcobacter thereius]